MHYRRSTESFVLSSFELILHLSLVLSQSVNDQDGRIGSCWNDRACLLGNNDLSLEHTAAAALGSLSLSWRVWSKLMFSLWTVLECACQPIQKLCNTCCTCQTPSSIVACFTLLCNVPVITNEIYEQGNRNNATANKTKGETDPGHPTMVHDSICRMPHIRTTFHCELFYFRFSLLSYLIGIRFWRVRTLLRMIGRFMSGDVVVRKIDSVCEGEDEREWRAQGSRMWSWFVIETLVFPPLFFAFCFLMFIEN